MGEGDHGSAARGRLRGTEVSAGPFPEFESQRAPADPVRLFLSWLSDAVADGLHDPDARVLILKGVDGAGWQFAGHGFSPAGQQPAVRPRAARSDAARAESLPARQGRYLADPAERDQALEKALALIRQEPSLVDSDWTLHTLAPAEAEFRQAARSRVHTRLRHERARDGRERFRLWS